MDTVHTDSVPAPAIAGFWRRLVALAIDLFLLGVAGMILGGLLFDRLARMGDAARLLGFAIALAYFGFGNSRLLDGQTVGKMLLGLRVIDLRGRLLSLPRSALRYVALGVPFFANGVSVDPRLAMSPVVGELLALVVFGGMAAIVYLYVFNRRTRQSLHDLAAGSLVVRAEPQERMPAFTPLWRGHLVVVALAGALALSAPVVARHFADSGPFADLLPLQGELARQPHVVAAQVAHGWSRVDGRESHYLQSSLRLDAPLVEDGDFARQIAGRMAHGDPRVGNEDAIVVELLYGYDIGIASGWRSHRYAFRPDQWR